LGVQPFVIGLIAVGAVVGLVIGRQTERARRTMKDYTAARAAVPKGRQIALTELGRAVRFIGIGAVAALVIFVAAWKSGNH
jgi:hypothetical protein